MRKVPSTNAQTAADPARDGGPVAALLRPTANVPLFRSTDGRCYAQVPIRGRLETHALRSDAFHDWLVKAYLHEHGVMPSDWAVRRALAALEATARFETGTPSVHNRVGRDGDGKGSAGGSVCYVDLADPPGRAIRISPEGWTVVDDPPIRFRRPVGHMPLPMPERGGSIDLLRPYLNVPESEFRLLASWLAAALRPKGPYPVLVVTGEQGSAKSTLTRVLSELIDPQAAPLLVQPRSTDELLASARNAWLVSYDNLSKLPDWLSNTLCMVATAGAVGGAGSLAGDERRVIHANRPVILNGIGEFVRRADLSDRAIFLNLQPIIPANRQCEDEFWAAFYQDYPRILGGLLDAVAGGLRELPSVRLETLPRLADFARFAEAVGRSLGWPDGAVLADYDTNRRNATIPHLEDSVVGLFLLDLSLDYYRKWSGTPTRLYDELTELAVDYRESPRWPKSPTRLVIELKRIAPQLRIHGISFTFTRNRYGRVVTVERINTIGLKDIDA
jgi:hypothetical protein